MNTIINYKVIYQPFSFTVLADSVCDAEPCFNGGVCIRDDEDTSGQYICQCRPGYIGANCEEGKAKPSNHVHQIFIQTICILILVHIHKYFYPD